MNALENLTSQIDSLREDIPAVLLVGGLGTRLRPVVSSKPKPLAPIGDIPFLGLLILQLRSQGIRRLVMCTGHQADKIEQEFGDGHEWDVTIIYSRESSPLGTAGAVKLASHYVSGDSDFLVMNGDSFLQLDIRQFIRFHRERGGWVSIAVRRISDASQYGTVYLDESSRVVGFSEKLGVREPAVINGGVYVFNRAILRQIPEGIVSLEKDVLPRIIEHGVYGIEQNGMFIDIGTPEDYARAQSLKSSLRQAAISESQQESQESLPQQT